MKKNSYILSFFILSVFTFISCSDDDTDLNEVIPTSKFELNAHYDWSLSKQKEEFYIVKNTTEMQNYVKSLDDAQVVVNMPDFNKHTLLLASGTTLAGVSKIETQLIKHNNTNYTFEINVYTNLTTVAEGYIVAIIIPQLPANAKVTKKAIIQPYIEE